MAAVSIGSPSQPGGCAAVGYDSTAGPLPCQHRPGSPTVPQVAGAALENYYPRERFERLLDERITVLVGAVAVWSERHGGRWLGESSHGP